MVAGCNGKLLPGYLLAYTICEKKTGFDPQDRPASPLLPKFAEFIKLSTIEFRHLPCLWYKVDEADADLSTFFKCELRDWELLLSTATLTVRNTHFLRYGVAHELGRRSNDGSQKAVRIFRGCSVFLRSRILG